MNIAIYQVNMDRDNDNVAFLNYENLERFQGSNMINSKIYDKVFEGEVGCGSLEEVYRMFNIDHPDGYRGRSLSVSDVVEVASEEKSTFYFCNSIGFKEIDFAPDMAETLKEKRINVVLCEPGKLARAATIEASLERYQKIVGGTFFVCDCSGKNFGGLSPDQLRRYTELFKYPERFFRAGNDIKAVPYIPERSPER